ncbi:DUF115 domain-containing protein [Shewanella sp. SG44-2]|uniref:motility associated factor glycosyltransferase family protein n=1 Tax=Shewanella sp. SG44-2 TaxID=2760962 RepID=UPI00160254FB|nr:6-hydroxymethylpterin diphosphokinase MptE-like protein [Shewanella sp. SG44-2]MBB1428733.1 DUF115 domain-containing protein [Shewanella sp. SG44-2]
MTKLFQSNLTIIQKRWPMIAAALTNVSFEHLNAHLVQGNEQSISVNGIQLSSRHDRIKEANLYISQLVPEVCHVVVYGLGMGDVPHILSQLPQITTFEVAILNLSLFALLISYTEQIDWLTSDKLTLTVNHKQNRLASNYLAISSDLNLVENENTKLRDLINYEYTRQFANIIITERHEQFLHRLVDNIEFIEKDLDISELKLTNSVGKAIVIASGPTLEESYNDLREILKLKKSIRPTIIAVDTAVIALVSEGIEPDIVVTIDAWITEGMFPNPLNISSSLVYFPLTNSDLLRCWPGKRCCAYTNSDIFTSLMKRFPRQLLFSNGSVIHPAIDIAVKLGAKEVQLIGADFCYPFNKTHAFWKDGELGVSLKMAKKQWLLNVRGSRALTDFNFKAYLRGVEYYIENHPEVIFSQTHLESAKIDGAIFKKAL